MNSHFDLSVSKKMPEEMEATQQWHATQQRAESLLGVDMISQQFCPRPVVDSGTTPAAESHTIAELPASLPAFVSRFRRSLVAD